MKEVSAPQLPVPDSGSRLNRQTYELEDGRGIFTSAALTHSSTIRPWRGFYNYRRPMCADVLPDNRPACCLTAGWEFESCLSHLSNPNTALCLLFFVATPHGNSLRTKVPICDAVLRQLRLSPRSQAVSLYPGQVFGYLRLHIHDLSWGMSLPLSLPIWCTLGAQAGIVAPLGIAGRFAFERLESAR